MAALRLSKVTLSKSAKGSHTDTNGHSLRVNNRSGTKRRFTNVSGVWSATRFRFSVVLVIVIVWMVVCEGGTQK